MAFKAAIVSANAGARLGAVAGYSLLASCGVLLMTIAFRAFALFG